MLRLCADLFGEKINIEVEFDLRRGIAELRDAIVDVLNTEMTFMRGGKPPPAPFQIYRLQVFDDTLLRWVDLTASEQIFEGAQLYAFQPQTTWHTDVQKDLPPSRPPLREPRQDPAAPSVAFAPPAAAPATPSWGGAAAPQPQQPPMHESYSGGRVVAYENGRDGATTAEKVAYLFDEIDAHEKGVITLSEFSGWIRELIDFSDQTLLLLFNSADQQRKGTVTREDFTNGFAKRFGNVVEVAFHRAADRWDVTTREQLARNASQQLSVNQVKEAEVERQIEALQAQMQTLGQQLNGLKQEDTELQQSIQINMELNRSVAHRQATMHAEEQSLMEREICMEMNREQLRESEAMFYEQTQRYDRAASALGSPRRSRRRH
eukprot:TRINITY_DN20024_c0_g1_i1.p1 TRINITY_DN20024_c0_g1~~TRINITY_DN20024_c0_g1_i1.p1  ORF type:complete len:377 (+),score=151.45 TRINITY_DN20024_c0_g1_i1:79-1209(+)